MTDKIFCTNCGQIHFGPCTVGHVEALRLLRRREKIQNMREQLRRARVINDARMLAIVVGDLIDMIEGEQR